MMKGPNNQHLIEEQRLAISADGQKLIIHAGAGAGKTSVLVQRYLRHVTEHQASPEEILAITFTRKAAAEMRARIVRALREQGLLKEARLAQVGPISTVDGFCDRLLRENPVEAGVDSQFDVLSQDQGTTLMQECILFAIGKAPTLSPYARQFIARCGKREWRGQGRAEERGVSLVQRLISKLRTAGVAPHDIKPYAGNPEQLASAWSKTLDEFVERLLGGPPPPEWQTNPELLRRAFRDAKRPRPSWLSLSHDPQNDRTSAELTSGLIEIVVVAWEKFLEELQARRVMDFAEMEIRAIKLLENHPEVLQGKYRFLLVDEAQDLNPLQYRLLRSLPIDHVLFVGDPQQSIYRFRGADVRNFVKEMQNTPRYELQTNWRSTRRILDVVERIFRPRWGENLVRMTTPSEHTEAQDEPEDPFGEVSLKAGDPVEIWHLPPKSSEFIAQGIHSLIQEGVSPGEITILVRRHQEVDAIARGLLSLKIPFSPLDVGRNYFLRTEIYDLASAIRALCNPHDDLALLSTLRSPLVGISLDGICRLRLSAMERGISVWQLLSEPSPNGGLLPLSEGDEEALSGFLRWFRTMSAYASQMSAWEVLSEILVQTQLDARLSFLPHSRQLIANARKLLEVAGERKDLSPMAFAEWIDRQQRLRGDFNDAPIFSDQAEAVRIATVHNAKGLEWDVVVVLVRSPIQRNYEEVLLDPESNLPVFSPKKEACLFWRIVCAQEQQNEKEEELRLLYVAMTRAKKRLCLAVLSGTHSDYWHSIIVPSLLDRPLPDLRVRDFGGGVK